MTHPDHRFIPDNTLLKGGITSIVAGKATSVSHLDGDSRVHAVITHK
jgi:molybdopterin-binding protein